MGSLNSRERVLLSLRHREPDMVPIDFGGTGCTTIMAIAYNRLKKHLGIDKGETRVCHIALQTVEPEEELLRLMGTDCLDTNRTLPPAAAPSSDLEWEPWTLPDGSPAMVPAAFSVHLFSPVTYRHTSKATGRVKLLPDGKGGWLLKDGSVVGAAMPKSSLYFDDVYHPLEKAESKKEIDAFFEASNRGGEEWPPVLSKADAESLGRRAKYLYDNTDYALSSDLSANFFEAGWYLRGFKTYLTDIVRRRELILHLNDKLTEYYKSNLRVWLGAVKDYVQVGCFGDDLAGQEGPLLSPKNYREVFKPYEMEVFQYVKKNSDLFVWFHCCGSAYALLSDLVEVGVDILNPVQVSAKDMEPRKLKKEFGEDLSFWGGGVNTQRVLGTATPAQVAQDVKENMEAFAPGGGFVFGTVHNVLANVPPENVLAIFEAARKYRKYDK